MKEKDTGMANLSKLSLILFLSLMPIMALAAEGKHKLTDLQRGVMRKQGVFKG